MILVIDNYDSFVHNLARYLAELGEETLVRRNRELSVEEIRRLSPRALLISPGPCDPSRAGVSVAAVAELTGRLPILGICLGHQAIGEALGGRVVRAREPVHGMASPIHHDGKGIFRKLPSPFEGGRYHSLVVEESSLPPELEVTAHTPDGRGGRTVMALRHLGAPTIGLQFHPESVLTEHGHDLLRNFLAIVREFHGEKPARREGGGRTTPGEPPAGRPAAPHLAAEPGPLIASEAGAARAGMGSPAGGPGGRRGEGR
jgi:anthranilate synthase/aminodeoxychorismate synthase-like glutamine amidotransferase